MKQADDDLWRAEGKRMDEGGYLGRTTWLSKGGPVCSGNLSAPNKIISIYINISLLSKKLLEQKTGRRLSVDSNTIFLSKGGPVVLEIVAGSNLPVE